jgi:nitrate reductase alpha subunit
MSDPIKLIGALLDEIGEQADVEESAQWYLRSYLIDYKRALLRQASSQEIEFATAALMRFCAQSLDAKAPLYRACVEVAEEGAKVAARLNAPVR